MYIAPAYFLVELRVDGLQLRETDKVSPHEYPQLQPLLLPPLLLLGVALVLHPHPELVHLGKVLEDEVDGVLHRSIIPAQSSQCHKVRL